MEMGRLPGIIWVLSVLVTSGYALACTLCGSSYSSTCSDSGLRMVCSPGEVCGSSYTEIINDEKTFPIFRRACIAQDDCDFKGNRQLHRTKYRVANTCCPTDGCTPPVPTLIPISDEPNGLVCPSCVNNTIFRCNTSEIVKCTGNETVCFFLEMKGSTGEDTSNMWGCATHSYCDHVAEEDIKILHATGVAPANYLCFRGLISVQNVIQTPADISTPSSGGISIQKVVLTPAIVCLLLLKWLF